MTGVGPIGEVGIEDGGASAVADRAGGLRPEPAAQSQPVGAHPSRVAALYVENGGCYFGLPGVDPWDEARDARLYDGPFPVVAHPPCQRWGKLWAGQPLWIKRTGERKVKGDDGGCFAAALAAVRQWGGVLEHPWGSHAWPHFGTPEPFRDLLLSIARSASSDLALRRRNPVDDFSNDLTDSCETPSPITRHSTPKALRAQHEVPSIAKGQRDHV